MKNFQRLILVMDRCHMIVLGIDSPLAATYRKLREQIEILGETKSKDDYIRIVKTWGELLSSHSTSRFGRDERACLEIAYQAAYACVQAINLYMAGDMLRFEGHIQEAQTLMCQYNQH